MTTRSRTRIEQAERDLDDVLASAKTRHQATHQSDTLNTTPKVENDRLGLVGWLLIMAFITFLGFMILEIVTSLKHAWTLHPAVSMLLGSVSLVFGLLLLLLIWRETRAYWRLGVIQADAQNWQQVWQQQDDKQLETLLNHLLKLQRNSPQAAPLVRAYHQTIQDHHTVEQKLFIYDSMVAQPLLKKAKTLINNEALRAGGIGLLSLNTMMETLTLLWRSARVVKVIAQLYGYQPGLVGNVKLLKISLENVIIQQTTDMLIEEGVSVLGKGLLSGLSQQAGKAASTGVLVKRIGKSTLRLLTPISHLELQARVADVTEKSRK